MASWIFNRLRMLGKWLTRVLPIEYQAKIGARLEQGISGVYHERQRPHQDVCLLRALNNLLQGEGAFTRRELDEIAAPLKLTLGYEDAKPWWSRSLSTMLKRHRSFLRDFNANVLRPALATRNEAVEWYDDPIEGVEGLSDLASYGDKLVGILLNFQQPVSKERHWVAIRRVGTHWYNLDSLLDKPCILPNEDALKKAMDSAWSNSGCVVIVLQNDTVGESANSSPLTGYCI